MQKKTRSIVIFIFSVLIIFLSSILIAASTKDQFAAQVKALGHGVFTYTLFEGLKGQASAGDKTMTVRKLMTHVKNQLPDITMRHRKEAQFPVVDSRGMDFPLVIIK